MSHGDNTSTPPLADDVNIRMDIMQKAITDMSSVFRDYLLHQNNNNAQQNTSGNSQQTVDSREGKEQLTLVKQFQNMNPPSFKGIPDPNVAESWVKKLEKMFKLLKCTNKQKVELVVFKLEGEADDWWIAAQDGFSKRGKKVTWDKFVQPFYRKYFSEAILERQELEFMNLKQDDMAVDEYQAKFNSLVKFAPYFVNDEARKARKFQKGLKASIKNRVVPQMLKTYDEVLATAQIIEQDMDEQKMETQDQKDGISVDPSKVEAVVQWERSTSVTEVRSFLGLARYYRSFQKLKNRLVTAPILAILDNGGNFVPTLLLRIKEAQQKDSRLMELMKDNEKSLKMGLHISDDGVIRLGDRICVPYDEGLRVELLQEIHKSNYTIHPGSTNILIKSAHFLAIKQKDPLDKLAKLYVREIVRLHRVLVIIVSDRDPRFIARFGRSFKKAMGTQLKLSTAYHPQTDGQFERTIQVLEDMLRACALDSPKSWDDHLPLVEFAYNNSYHSNVKMAPYEALYGRRRRTPICWVEVGYGRLMGLAFVQQTTEKISLQKAPEPTIHLYPSFFPAVPFFLLLALCGAKSTISS
ncbi:hypothetical protein SLEP1_g18864 [Rubroshorea leprosula]|uniref:Integrase catalytic domain-containing protein n=1 Tax=Rubroshorea leprosula TaxID=152421 RepID=A0AAV5IYX1_9ROSI|nr:hypothetical protein SLEP1_g18864 [Rubroshorea leprosula]